MTDQELRLLPLEDFVEQRYGNASVEERARQVALLKEQSRTRFFELVREMLTPLEQQHFEEIVLGGSLRHLYVFLLLRDPSLQEMMEEAQYSVKYDAW